MTNRKSFDAIAWWFEERSKHAPAFAVKMIVGNKSDKVGRPFLPLTMCWMAWHGVLIESSIHYFSVQGHMRQISEAEGSAFAARMGCMFVESSAKTAVGVRETFRDVVERIVNTSAL